MNQVQAEREKIFETFVASTIEVADTLGEAEFEPEILPIVSRIRPACDQVFLPRISDDGYVEVPDERVHQEGFAVIPKMSEDERLLFTPSLIYPTPTQIQDAAHRSKVEPEKLSARLLGFLAEPLEWTQQDEELPIHEMADAWADMHGTTYSLIDNKLIHYYGRPYIVLSAARLGSFSVAAQGFTGAHELFHCLDLERLSAQKGLNSAEVDMLSAWLELRGYRVEDGAVEISSDEVRTEMHQRFPNIRRVEQLRRRNATPRRPFNTTPETVRTLREWKVI